MMLAVTLSGSMWRAIRPDRGLVQASNKERRKRHDGQATRLKDPTVARPSSQLLAVCGAVLGAWRVHVIS